MAAESTPFAHQPVLLAEVLGLVEQCPPGIFVDATLGGAGHSDAILEARPDLSILGIDRDADALQAAAARLASRMGRVSLVQSRFDHLGALAKAESRATGRPVVGVLADLGVSSPQLDRAERGFSYRHDAPLDMRMDQSQTLTAADVVNGYGEAELARVLRDYGDERFALRIARRIVDSRPLASTLALAEVVTLAIPAATRRRGGHPAKRTFQALRIEVNDELGALRGVLDAALEVIVPGGRLIVITYHSGEDRIVKAALRHATTGGCTCPPGLPCVCGARPRARNLTRGGITPSAAEISATRRAASARLRAVEIVDSTATDLETATPGSAR